MNRNDFCFLTKFTYLDTGSGALKPKQVINEINNFYNNFSINPHSIDSQIGMELITKITNVRKICSELINAFEDEIIFTSGTTSSLNIIATMLKQFLNPGDEIIISPFNHASNFIIWCEIAADTGAKIIESEIFIDAINKKTKIVAFAQQNNTISKKLDRTKIFKMVKKNNGIIVNDAAQAILHEKVSLSESDVVVFSGNKLYGPTGIGILAVKKELLNMLKPISYGGGANSKFTKNGWIAKDSTAKFEPGTINTAGIIGLGEAIKYFNKNKDWAAEKKVAQYAFDQLLKIKNVKIHSQRGDINIIFNIVNCFSQDVVSYLGHRGVILRAGDMCVKALDENIYNSKNFIRISIGGYNNIDDINKMIKLILEGGDFIEL